MSAHRKQRPNGAFLSALIALLLFGFLMTPMSANANEDDVVDETTTSSVEDQKSAAVEPAPEEKEVTEEETIPAPIPDPVPVVEKEEVATVVEAAPSEEKAEEPAAKPSPAAPVKVKKLTIIEEPELCQFTVTSVASNPTVEGVANDGQRDGYAVPFVVAPGESTVVKVYGDVKGGFYYGEGQYDPNSGEGVAKDFALNGDYSACVSTPPVEEPQESTVVVDTGNIPCVDPFDFEATTSVSFTVTNPKDGAGAEKYKLQILSVFDGEEFPYGQQNGGTIKDGKSKTYSFDGLYAGDYIIRVTNKTTGVIVDSTLFTVESCEVNPSDVVITSEECKTVSFFNPNERFVGIDYGSFDEEGPDGSIEVGAGETATITTDRSALDGLIYLEGIFFFQEFMGIEVSQECDPTTPPSDGGDTPPLPGVGDGDDDSKDDDPVVTPVANTSNGGSVKGNVALPNTGGAPRELLIVGFTLALAGSGVFLASRRRKFVG